MEIIGYLVNSKEVQSIWPMYSAVCCVRISAVAECLTPGQMQSGRGAMLCTACKTGAALHILPGSCTKTTPGFSFTKKQK